MGLDLHPDEVMFWLLPRPVRVICDYYSSSLAARDFLLFGFPFWNFDEGFVGALRYSGRGFFFLGFLFRIWTTISWEPFGILCIVVCGNYILPLNIGRFLTMLFLLYPSYSLAIFTILNVYFGLV